MSVQHPERVVTKQDLKDFYDSILPYLGGSEGGGGLLPHLIIISEDGESEVKAVKGSTEIMATRTSAGHYECDVPEFGTWTIHAVLNGDDAVVNLVVDTVKVYTVDDSHWHADITVTFPHSLGATCSCSKEGTTTLYATESPYTFTVHEAGTYTITTEYDSNVVSETISVSTNGEQKSMIAPTGADALPVNDIDLWLFFAGIDNSESTYSSLSDILADDDALVKLMISDEAVDYLVRSTSWASNIVASEDAMKAIGASDYASETLLSDSTWLTAIDGSAYKAYAINISTPTMTSATTPEGEVFQSTTNSSRYGYCAFDKSDDTWWASTTQYDSFIGYKFVKSSKIYAVKVVCGSHAVNNQSPKNVKIQYSTDGNTYNDDTSILIPQVSNAVYPISHLNTALYWRMFCTDNYGGTTATAVEELDFYGRENGGVQTWLHAAGITDKNYTTLAEVLADSTTLSALMASEDAVDYLVTCKGWATEICSDSDAMTYIGLNNYCADTLLADSTWCSAMLQSSYKESVLNVKVPTMTSNNTPSGVCSGSGNNSQVQFYHAFDNDTSTYWLPPSGATNNYIGYAFADSVDIFGVDLQYKIQGSTPARTLTIQHGDSNTDIDTLSIPADSGSSTSRSVSKPFSNKVNDSKFRLFCSNTLYSKGSWFIEVLELQFYGRTDV